MTIDKFTLKTRGVYKAVSAMSVGFFLLDGMGDDRAE